MVSIYRFVTKLRKGLVLFSQFTQINNTLRVLSGELDNRGLSPVTRMFGDIVRGGGHDACLMQESRFSGSLGGKRYAEA